MILSYGEQWHDTDRGKQKYSGTTCPNVAVSTTNITRIDLVSNPAPHGERPATNRLSHSTALKIHSLLNYTQNFSSYCRQNTFRKVKGEGYPIWAT